MTSIQPKLSDVVGVRVKCTLGKALKTRWPFDFHQTTPNGIDPSTFAKPQYVGNCYGRSGVVELMAAFELRSGVS